MKRREANLGELENVNEELEKVFVRN